MITVDRRLVNVKRIANECHLAISDQQEERNVKALNNAATKLDDVKRRYLKTKRVSANAGSASSYTKNVQ